MVEKLMQLLESKEDTMIALRRHMHEHPELSFEEVQTSAFIKKFYEGKPVTIDEVPDRYGFVVTINKGKSDNVLTLRADFDALPIQELTDLPYKSQVEGKMHACGHDMHTAYLMGLADALIEMRDEIPGTIKIIHQHAEEMPPGGARDFMKSGLLDDVKRIYGIHVNPLAPVGMVNYHYDDMFSGSMSVTLKIKGKGGHGSEPQLANDAIVAGSHFVVAAQTIVSRRLDPREKAVLTIGSFDAKGAKNVVQENVELGMTVRYYSDAAKKVILDELERISNGTKAMFDVETDLQIIEGNPPLINNPEIVKEALSALSQNEHAGKLYEIPFSVMASEDFATYLRTIPGCFMLIGTAQEKNPASVHNGKFNPSEKALLHAAKVVGLLALDYFDVH